MSRIGKEPVPLPDGVEVSLDDGVVTVTGPNGTLTQEIPETITVTIGEREVVVTRPDDERENRAKHGLVRALLANMVTGVTEGFERNLEIVGVGYRAEARGTDKLVIQVGYSHPVEVDAPEGITFAAPSPTKIQVRGANKRLVGRVAADIRAIRKPEPYKGKGIRYQGEHIRRKSGKAGIGA
jgi:large subunit ribosomal protein L6